MLPLMLRENGIHESSSRLKRWMRRKKWTPHCLSLPATYRIDLKGMAISTIVAGLVDHSLRVKQHVDAKIFAAAFSQNAVALNA